MNIHDVQFELLTSSFKIFVSGCDGACEGCFNPSLFDFNNGKILSEWTDYIEKTFKKFNKLIERVQILGGEPLLQNSDELIGLLSYIKQYNKPIILFTRFELEEVPNEIIKLVDYVKTGKYDQSKLARTEYYGITLNSSNQKIHKCN